MHVSTKSICPSRKPLHVPTDGGMALVTVRIRSESSEAIHADGVFWPYGVETALENAGKLHPAGEEGHIWIAAQDVNPQGYDAMLSGYIDVATTYDAYFHAVELVVMAVRLAEGEPVGAPKVLVPGRVATAETVADMEYIWARDYAD